MNIQKHRTHPSLGSYQGTPTLFEMTCPSNSFGCHSRSLTVAALFLGTMHHILWLASTEGRQLNGEHRRPNGTCLAEGHFRPTVSSSLAQRTFKKVGVYGGQARHFEVSGGNFHGVTRRGPESFRGCPGLLQICVPYGVS